MLEVGLGETNRSSHSEKNFKRDQARDETARKAKQQTLERFGLTLKDAEFLVSDRQRER
ncbi:hypothetical protein NQZ68_009147 [Dissostichus eleginoides]|nr:hypothetical protein NQZ68_009147 [Dissostichus eleginoides]